MKDFFKSVVRFVKEEGPLLPPDNFEPPIQLPIGLKIKVADANLTDEQKKQVPHIAEGGWKKIDADGCITVGKLDLT